MRISEDILNSHIEYCIAEFVRLEEHRNILREHWFGGLSIKQLSDKYAKSETAIKSVLYDVGDKILLRAAKMSGTD